MEDCAKITVAMSSYRVSLRFAAKQAIHQAAGGGDGPGVSARRWNVADRVHVGDAGVLEFVDHDETAVVDRHANAFQARCGCWASTGGEDHAVVGFAACAWRSAIPSCRLRKLLTRPGVRSAIDSMLAQAFSVKSPASSRRRVEKARCRARTVPPCCPAPAVRHRARPRI